MTSKFRFDTLQVHAGQDPDPATGARAVPIYQTTSYVFENADHAADLFALKTPGNIYTRIMNPTVDVFEKRMTALEGGTAAVAAASGSAAITYALLNIAGTGDHIVAASTIYGGTYNLLAQTLPRLGINTTFVHPDDLEKLDQAITPRTKAVFVETIGNPETNIADIASLAEIAHNHRIPLIVDNTFATPYLCRPIEFGADIVVHSATKFIGGHGTSIGGVVIDGGSFDWEGSGRFAEFSQPDPSYNGISPLEAFGSAAYAVKLRIQLLRDTGACLSPFNAFLFLQGLETLSLRMERHCHNAQRIAQYLSTHPNVSWVNFPGLPDNKYHARAQRYLSGRAGSIFTFGIKGGLKAGKRFINSLQLFSLLANVADAKSLVIHPASTTHAQLSPEQQLSAGVQPDMIRLSIGIEDADDLIDDLEQALAKAAEEE